MKTNYPKRILIAVFVSMAAASATSSDLADLATVVDRTSHRASSYDRTGANNDNITSFEPGRTVVLLDTDGPGLMTHMWFTVSSFPGHTTFLRDLVIRIYWENTKVPSVEVPLGDFFGLGHGRIYPVASLPINVGADPRALNCYWPMPFHKHARIELFNHGQRSIRRIYFNLDYELGPIPENQGLFHAEFRSKRNLPPQQLVANTTGKDNYVILDAKGQGHYVGCFLFVDSAPGGWWGEGDEMILIDGEQKPSINGTGTEDYFCEAWGFDRVTGFPFYGLPLLDKLPDRWTQTSCYRFHVLDPVRFKKSIRVTIEHGWKGKVANDYSSVAYWYQREPTASRQPLPKHNDYQPRNHASSTARRPSSLRWSATRAEAALRRAGVAARAITTGYDRTSSGGFLRIDAPNQDVAVPVPLLAPGTYRVQVRLLDPAKPAPVILRVEGSPPKTVERIAAKGTVVDVGTVEVRQDGKLILTARSSRPLAIDHVLVKPIEEGSVLRPATASRCPHERVWTATRDFRSRTGRVLLSPSASFVVSVVHPDSGS